MLAADLIVTGGNLITLDPARPRATAMAVRGERICLVGDNAAVERLAGPGTARVELGGRTVTPGRALARRISVAATGRRR